MAMVAVPADDGGWTCTGSCKWRRDGDAFSFVWPETMVGFTVENIRETSSGDIYGECVAQTTAASLSHLHMWKLNLWSSTAHASAANFIKQTYPGINVPWREYIEYVRAVTIREWRRGEPPIRLAHVGSRKADRWMIPNFLLHGETSLLIGDRGSGKSTIALATYLAVASGRPIAAGLVPAVTGPTLYCDWETNKFEQRERAGAIARLMGLSGIPEDCHYQRLRRPLTEEMPRLKAYCSREGIVLGLIDSVLFATDDDPKEIGAATRFGNALAGLGDGVARLCVMHVSAAGAQQEKGAARAYGSIGWEAMARSIWETRTSELGGDAVAKLALTHTKLNGGRKRKPFGLEVTYDAGTELPASIRRADIADMPDLYERQSQSQRVRDLLLHGALTVADIAERTGIEANVLRATLSKMKRAGEVMTNEGHTNFGGRGVQTTWALMTARAEGQ